MKINYDKLFNMHQLELLQKEFLRVEKEYLYNEKEFKKLYDTIDRCDFDNDFDVTKKLIELNVNYSKLLILRDKIKEIHNLAETVKYELSN
jgi:hypothetical protein